MKTKLSVLALTILCATACQKENMAPVLIQSTQSDAVLSLTDSVKFVPQRGGELNDDATGREVGFLQSFEIVPHEDAYVKAFAFTLTHSAGAHLTSAKLFIDGDVPHIIPITTSTTKLIYVYTTAKAITVDKENLIGQHTIAMRITGDGAKGEWYQVRLDSAIFFKQDPRRNIVKYPLPQIGYRMIYHQFQ